jgi:hypothetical protein
VRAAPVYRFRRWWSVTGAVAAIAAAVVVAVVLIAGNSPALAGPEDLARMHDQVLAGESEATVVHSIDEANRALAAFHHDADLPEAPAAASGDAMPCCEAKLCGHTVASLVFDLGHVPVSIMLAQRGEMKCRGDGTVLRNNHSYVVAHADALNMVMEERNGRWLCLVGGASQEQLIALIQTLTF